MNESIIGIKKAETRHLKPPLFWKSCGGNKQEVVSFLGQENVQKMILIEQPLEEVDRNYPPGTIDFLKEKEQELWEKIVEEEMVITEALFTEGTGEFKEYVEK